MKRYHLIFALAAAGLWSCELDSIESQSTTGDYSEEIISISPLAEEPTALSSRGTPITGESQMTDIGVFCSYTGSSDWTSLSTLGKMFNTRLVRNAINSRWEYSGPPVSWSAVTSNDRYSFFAYAPYATAQNGIVVNGSSSTAGIPSITYTTPSGVAMQPDLMVATPRYNLRPATNTVALQMKHALTCVGFSAIGNGERVTSVTISGVASSGTMALNGTGAWTNLGTATFSLNAGVNTTIVLSSTPQNILLGNGYLMMIPQTLTNAMLAITLSTNATKTIPLSTQPTWVAGQRVQYMIATSPVAGGFGDRVTIRDGKLAITNNPNDPGLYFKCGSVVGVSQSADIANLAFNPTTGITITTFGNNSNIPPAVPGMTTADFNAGTTNISQNKYHNLNNVRIGKGDPCRLIGMTATEIKAFTNDGALYAREAALKTNGGGGWRTPTNAEMSAFTGSSGMVTSTIHWWVISNSIYGNPKVAGAEFPARNTSGIFKFLPALGMIDAFSGLLGSGGNNGRYWQGDVISGTGYHLAFSIASIYTSGSSIYTHAMSVRCVRVP